MDAFGGRKVVVALIVLLVGVGVVLYRGDMTTNLLTLLQTVFAAFVVGNGIENVVKAKAPKGPKTKSAREQAFEAVALGAPAPAPAPYVSNLESAVQDIDVKLGRLQATADATQDSLATTQQAVGVIFDIATRAAGGTPPAQ